MFLNEALDLVKPKPFCQEIQVKELFQPESNNKKANIISIFLYMSDLEAEETYAYFKTLQKYMVKSIKVYFDAENVDVCIFSCVFNNFSHSCI